MQAKLEESWKEPLNEALQTDYMRDLSHFLRQEQKAGRAFYPPPRLIFNALNATPLDKVKAVIIGQDPYHGAGQAMGLSFSVPPGVTKPPSLRNIFKELNSDLGVPIPTSGDLTPWTREVLLLNATLTVGVGKAGSHQGKGWEQFTDRIIQVVNERCENVVFILWGRYAQDKGVIIAREKHHVIASNHPSPFSANKPPVPFFGSRPFSRANDYLESQGLTPIDWRLN